MENAIISILLLVIIGGVILYLRRAKKRGVKCVGCPYAKQCAGMCGNAPLEKRP